MGLLGTALTVVGIAAAFFLGLKFLKHFIGAIIFAVLILLVLWFTGIVAM